MKRTEKITSFGFFNIDKPSGELSSAVVNKCKWLTGTPCGHMGTLDPLASGVLPVGVGNATRLFDYFLQKEKEYIADFTFGVYADTLDSTGELHLQGDIPTQRQIEEVLPTLVGEVMQIPPKYSAKNVNGKRGYDLARAGVEFELPAKQVQIDEIRLVEQTAENAFRFVIRCGGGTYIRSIARDMAAALSTYAVMSGLRRTKSGFFTLENAIPFEIFKQDLPVCELEKYLIPTQDVLPFATFRVEKKDETKLFNGMTVITDYEDGLYKLFKEESFYGILGVENHNAKIRTKLC